MKTTLPTKRAGILMAVLFAGSALTASLQAQGRSESTATPAVAHNTWSSGAPIPTPLAYTMTALLEGKIYVVGGYTGAYLTGQSVPDVQIYDPAANTWSTGVPLPTPIWSGAAAATDGILYIFGGTSPPPDLYQLNTVWAFNPKTDTWSAKAPMPSPASGAGTAVRDGIIYLVGGYDGGTRLNTVAAYDPKTDNWTDEASLLAGKSEASVGRIGDTIIAADGYTDSGDTGDNEAYDIVTNTWTSLTPDPTGRDTACGGIIGARFFVAGGLQGGGPGAPAINTAESYHLARNTWATLAPMPQATLTAGSAVYKGQLFCISGWAVAYGTLVNNVQIYQP